LRDAIIVLLLLYAKTIDVVIKHVLKNYTGDMLRSVVEQVEAFE